MSFFFFEDFDLLTKRSLPINACTCLNHQKLRLRLGSLSAGSSDEIMKFESVFWRIALRRANTPLDNFVLIESAMTVTFPCQVDWKFLIYDLCRVTTIHKTRDRVVKICNRRRK